MDMYSKICRLADRKGVSIAQVERDLGFSPSSLRKINLNKPGYDKIMALSKYFSVSIDFLCGNSDIEKTVDEFFDKDFISLQRARQKMSQEQWTQTMSMIRVGFSDAFEETKHERRSQENN